MRMYRLLGVLLIGLSSFSCRCSNPLNGSAVVQRWIAYDEYSDVHFIKEDGTGDTMFVPKDTLVSGESWPLWSPDFKYLLMYQNMFTSNRTELIILDTRTRQITPIFSFEANSTIIYNDSWSSSGGFVAFQNGEPNFEWRVVSVDGKVNVALDRGHAVGESFWSPQTDVLVFSASPGAGLPPVTYIYDAKSETKTEICDSMAIGNWSPDGENIIMWNLLRRHVTDTTLLPQNIYRYNIENKSYTQLTSDGESFTPLYSPDGRLIAFNRGPVADRTKWTLYVMDLVTETKTKIADPIELGNNITAGSLWWAPDSKQICYVERWGSSYGGDLYVVSADGNGRRLLRECYTVPGASWGPRVSDFTP